MRYRKASAAEAIRSADGRTPMQASGGKHIAYISSYHRTPSQARQTAILALSLPGLCAKKIIPKLCFSLRLIAPHFLRRLGDTMIGASASHTVRSADSHTRVPSPWEKLNRMHVHISFVTPSHVDEATGAAVALSSPRLRHEDPKICDYYFTNEYVVAPHNVAYVLCGAISIDGLTSTRRRADPFIRLPLLL